MSRWLVAIVGRPNVGKSTLFNRIVGARHAIVDDMPGVTRDRHYARTEWDGKPFTLIDTGGYVPQTDDLMEQAVREQAAVAIEEADLILFVVDGKAGELPADREIAGILRKSEKKVLLIVNKIDNERRTAEVGEFYKLGLGEPIPVSAQMGLRIGDMLDLVTRDFHPAQDSEDDRRLKIAVLGRPNVGKSSLVNVLTGQSRNIVTSIPGTTRDPIDSVIRFHGEEMVLIDTAGLRRRSRITESVEFYSTVRTIKSLDRCDVAVIMIDAEQGLQHQDLRVVELAMERRRASVLAVNKWDLIEKDERTASRLEKALREKLRKYDFLPILFISALTRQRVTKVIDRVRHVHSEQDKRITTGKLNLLMGEDIRTNPPRSRSGKEVRINYVTQVRTRPPVFSFFCNDPKLIEEQYRRYLHNRLRSHFGFEGVPLVLSFRKK